MTLIVLQHLQNLIKMMSIMIQYQFVLDFQFCRACVALWPFSLVEGPIQLFKLVSDSRQDDQDNGHASIGSGANIQSLQILA
jgi:hypothetical protein